MTQCLNPLFEAETQKQQEKMGIKELCSKIKKEQLKIDSADSCHKSKNWLVTLVGVATTNLSAEGFN